MPHATQSEPYKPWIYPTPVGPRWPWNPVLPGRPLVPIPAMGGPGYPALDLSDWHQVRGRPIHRPNISPLINPLIRIIGIIIMAAEAAEEILDILDASDDQRRHLERILPILTLVGGRDTELSPPIVFAETGATDVTAEEIIEDAQRGPSPETPLGIAAAIAAGSIVNGEAFSNDPYSPTPIWSPAPASVRTTITNPDTGSVFVSATGAMDVNIQPGPNVAPETPGVAVATDPAIALNEALALQPAFYQPLDPHFLAYDGVNFVGADQFPDLISQTQFQLVEQIAAATANFPHIGQLIETQIQNLPQPAVLPDTSLAVNVPTTNTSQGIDVRVTVRPQSQTAVYQETLRKDVKTASQMAYIALLKFVNKTWGELSELVDFAEVLMRNLTIDGVPLNTLIQDNRISKLLALALSGDIPEGKIELDMDGFMLGILQESTLDALIGIMSQAEKALLRRILPLNHPILNMYGLPTTWARRLGYDPYGLYLDPTKEFFKGR